MEISSASAATAADPSGSTGLFSDRAQTETFLQLLVAQIRSQDPLSPQDPTEFVSQLAEFSSLEQLIELRRSMQRIEQTLSSAAVPADESNESSAQAGL